MTKRDVGRQGLLEELQSGDPIREGVALRTLMGLLLEHAARELGARRDFVNAQADSVVQHAVAKELAEGREAYRRFENDEHLYGRLHLAVSHRIHEVLRSRKENARHLAQDVRGDDSGRDAAGRIPEPAAPGGDGDGSVTRIDRRRHLEERSAASRERLLAATPVEDRELVRLVVIEGRRSEAAAQELGIRADNIRARLSRLRRRLRERLLQPVLERLEESDRALVEALFIERVELEVLTGSAGAGRGDVAAVLARRVSELVQSPFAESLGEEGVVYLDRLLGRAKSAGGGAR